MSPASVRWCHLDGVRGMPKIRPAELLQVGGPVTLVFLWCNLCIWEIDQPSSISRHGREAANAIAALAAVFPSSGTYMAHVAAGRTFIDSYR
jgi:hypothetical protein